MAFVTEFRVEGESGTRMVFFFSTLLYRLPEGATLPIHQQVAWCAQCHAFICAERISSIDGLRNWIEELKSPKQKHLFIYGSEAAVMVAIEEGGRRLAWRQSRRSAERCLPCGSEAIHPADFGEAGSCWVNGNV